MSKKLVRPTQNQIREAAAGCQFKTQFREKFPRHYREARELGILKEVTEHMEDKRRKWTDARLAEEALKYSSRSDFSKQASSAYATARERGLLDQICHHMGGRATRTSSDTLYLCRVPGTDVYKVGITTLIQGLKRIEQLKRTHKCDLDLVLYAPMTTKVSQLEARLRAIGGDPGPEFPCWEFRKLTKPDLKLMLDTITKAMIDV